MSARVLTAALGDYPHTAALPETAALRLDRVAVKPISAITNTKTENTNNFDRPSTPSRRTRNTLPIIAPTPSIAVSQASPSAPRPNTSSAKPANKSVNGRANSVVTNNMTKSGPMPG